MKKKIGLFLEAEPGGGGTFQYCQAMLDAVCALPADRYSVVVGYTSRLWLKHLESCPVRAVSIPRGFWGRAFCQAWSQVGLSMKPWRRITPFFHPMAKALLAENCDLWIFPAQDERSYQLPVPALVSIHDLMHRYERRFPEVGSRWEYRNRERHYRNICDWAKGVLVDSEIGRQQVNESYGMDTSRIHVLPYIAPGYMHSREISGNSLDRYSLPPKFLFYPAQFWEHKNHRNLILAIGALKRELSDLKLVLAGSQKNGYESVLRLVEELKLAEDVIFLGYVPDDAMPELYRRARALIMPTYFGPTNIPPLEAFVAGCPAAISGIYGMPEQVGDAALLFNPDSVDEIAGCIRKLWGDDRLCAELASKGKAKTEKWGQRQFNERLKQIVGSVIFGEN